jgi:putative hydrolase of the HAD superfamily
MVKTILFDIYGMIIRRKARFSQRFSKDFDVPIERLLPFFKNEFQLCLVGKADLKQELKKYLNEWGWKKSVDELLKYWFEHDRDVNQEIIKSIENLRDKGIKFFLNTQNEKYIVNYALENIGLKKHFDGIFSSDKIGYIKIQKEYWETIHGKLGNPDKKNILCWDDEEKNVKVAKEFGFNAELYTDFNSYQNKINYYISIK